MELSHNPDQIWTIQKAKLLMQFSHLSESDVHFDYGMKDVMMSNLEAKLGKSRDELNSLLESYNTQ
jgi:hypothetical protein